DPRGLQRESLGPAWVVVDDLDLVGHGASSSPVPGRRGLAGPGRERGMKGHRGIRERLSKAGNLEMLRWILRRCEFRRDNEAEAVVVPMVAEEHTPLGTLL